MEQGWPQLKTSIERALHAAEANERGGLRIHVGSAEKMASAIAKHTKGEEKEAASKIGGDLHKAVTSIEISRAVSFLTAALETASKHAGGAAAPPAKS